MELTLTRRPSGEKATIGELTDEDGRRVCYCLEDPVRERPGEPVSAWKVKGETAIPAGRYKVIVTFSPRFKRELPLLVRVPGFEGVRIHSGNRPEDTEGCILPGRTAGNESVGNSRAAFAEVMDVIEGALEAGEEVWLTVHNPEREQVATAGEGVYAGTGMG